MPVLRRESTWRGLTTARWPCNQRWQRRAVTLRSERGRQGRPYGHSKADALEWAGSQWRDCRGDMA